MKRLTFAVCLSLALFASLAIADDSSRNNSEQTKLIPFNPIGTNSDQLYGGTVNAGKVEVDSVYVFGGPGVLTGKFQTELKAALPDDQGWIGKDSTNMSATWHISDYNCANLDPLQVDPPNLAMWCGEIFPGPCDEFDPVEGYDNNYNLWLDWYGDVTVMVEGLPVIPTITPVNVKAIINSNSEVDYDYLILQVETLTYMEIVNDPAFLGTPNGDVVFTDVHVAEVVDVNFNVLQNSYVGEDLNLVHLRWFGFADTGYSDGDCFWPSDGLAQIDNIEVYFGADKAKVLKTRDTFQTGDPVSWVNVKPPYVGDFHKVWPMISDLDNDACATNDSPQMLFLDDNVVVPGTTGTWPATWNYGPAGAGVTTTGGLAGDTYGINNDVWSPLMSWPAGYDGATIRFNTYLHLPLANGIFYQWAIRTSVDGGLTWPGSWKDNNTVYYGGNLGVYTRSSFVVTGQMNPDRDTAQIALGVAEPWVEDYTDNNSTPSPYFDNVVVVAYKASGPALSMRGAWDMFNDGWPEIDQINYTDLTQNSVRVDIGNNISARETELNDPGDSVVVKFVARTGATSWVNRRMYFKMKMNPLFGAACRTALTVLPAGWSYDPLYPNILSGNVNGYATRTAPWETGTAIPYCRTFDFPDTGFFFPGDMIHYYFLGQDVVGGVTGSATLPADTTGFSYFPGNDYYDSGRYYELYKIDALPTMITAEKDVGQPHVLFWDDSQDRGNQNEWFAALDNLGFRQGIDYDIYCEVGPSSGLGNGLGGRTNALKMSGYQTMLYTPASLSAGTISNGDPGFDPGNDIFVVNGWLEQGNKNIFATGDNIAQDLAGSGANSLAFLTKWFGVQYDEFDISPYIGGQTAPRVAPITVPLAPVLFGSSWIVQGGCPGGGIADFDAITAIPPAVKIAEFLDANNNPMPAVTYAAAVYNTVVANSSRAVFMPYDLGGIWDRDKIATRTGILRNVLLFFGHTPGPAVVGVTPEAVFTARNFPNPFNPSTKIEFTLPVKGQVELKIYNVRGELVKTLLNEIRDAKTTHSVIWDGRNSAGQSVSSGVYFYSLKAGSYEKMEKMTLVK
jgi:hypothetical protein